MERSEMIEEILRLYVFILDRKDQEILFRSTVQSSDAKMSHSMAISIYDQLKVYIEDHFRPLA